MDEFGKRGATEGEIAHDVRADGPVAPPSSKAKQSNDSSGAALACSEFMTFTITPILEIDDASTAAARISTSTGR